MTILQERFAVLCDRMKTLLPELADDIEGMKESYLRLPKSELAGAYSVYFALVAKIDENLDRSVDEHSASAN